MPSRRRPSRISNVGVPVPTPPPAPTYYWGATIGVHQYGIASSSTWPSTTLTNATGNGWDNFVSVMGKAPSVVGYGHSWQGSVGGAVQGFNSVAKAPLDRALAKGAIPMLTWSPQASGGGKTQTDFQTAKIAAGTNVFGPSGGTISFDSYIDTYAGQLHTWANGSNALGVPVPVFIRMAHEMNLIFSTGWCWSDGANSNASGDHKAMWQHVISRFRATCPNATFLWCVNNITSAGATSITNLYPGDSYVDWVSIDAYSRSSIATNTFTAILNATSSAYDTITGLTSKPMIIAEVGVVDGTTGQKGTWLQNMLTTEIAAKTAIKALLYYDKDDYPDSTNPVDVKNTTPAADGETKYAAAVASTNYRAGDTTWLTGLGHAVIPVP